MTCTGIRSQVSLPEPARGELYCWRSLQSVLGLPHCWGLWGLMENALLHPCFLACPFYSSQQSCNPASPLDFIGLKWSLLTSCSCCLCHLNIHLGTFTVARNYYINLTLLRHFHFCTVTSASLYDQGRNLWKGVSIPRAPHMSKLSASVHQETSPIYGPVSAVSPS